MKSATGSACITRSRAAAVGPKNTSKQGDLIADTHRSRHLPSAVRSAATRARRPVLDPIENFMDYSDDVCMVNFTAEQDRRAQAQFAQYRYLK
jgi:hypothetical protein